MAVFKDALEKDTLFLFFDQNALPLAEMEMYFLSPVDDFRELNDEFFHGAT